MIQEKEEGFYNRSLERALQILNTFDTEKENLTLAQISSILTLPRATVLRLCSTLVKYSFLKQDPETKRYSLGIRLFELGSIVYNSFSLRRIASPHLSQLKMKVGTTVFLGTLNNDELLYMDKKEDPKNPVRFTSAIGRRRPPYWGMLGPAILAHQSDSEIDRILDKHRLEPTAKKSFVNKEEFVAWLRQIREQGFAIDDERAMDGISGVAAPIRDASGRVFAAVGIAFISSSLDSKGVDRIVKEATATANNISRELGCTEIKE
ncbi:MAG: IclR family transcriptional regulator [Syntrophobacterales bacterium]|jgi:DNA-binding IclR family transcriptional regulator|nr:IclR family transcriptional regulator [Syntrophobacterales bacterium]